MLNNNENNFGVILTKFELFMRNRILKILDLYYKCLNIEITVGIY